MTRSVSIYKIIICTGSFLAFYMGAAFASGLEVFQNFAAFGSEGFKGIVMVMILYGISFYIVQEAAQKEKFDDPFKVFDYFCGEKLGKVFTIICCLLFVGNLIMMTASAGANLHEGLGFEPWVGRCIFILSVLSVCLGLDKIIAILSKIGPFIGIVIIIIAIISYRKSTMTFAEADDILQVLDVYKGGPTLKLASLKYGFYVICSAFSTAVVCGSRCHSPREAKIAAIVEVIALGAAFAIIMAALLVNVNEIYNYEIPSLKLVDIYLPAFATAFSAFLLICTYSSSTIQLWTLARKVAEEKTPKYYIANFAVGAVVMIVSSLLPFSVILNRLFMAGYVVGPVFFICLIAKKIRSM